MGDLRLAGTAIDWETRRVDHAGLAAIYAYRGSFYSVRLEYSGGSHVSGREAEISWKVRHAPDLTYKGRVLGTFKSRTWLVRDEIGDRARKLVDSWLRAQELGKVAPVEPPA